MDLIDRRSLLELYANEDGLVLDDYRVPVAVVRQNILDAPTVDAVPVVRCRDCVYAIFDRWHKSKENRPPVWRCRKFGRLTVPDGFCHKGKIREEDQNADD